MSVGDEGYWVACRVRELRQERGWGYAEMSRRTGGKLADLALRRIENLERRIDVDDLTFLADALNVPVTSLLGVGSPSAPDSTDQFRILTVAQVAERLRVSLQVVYRLIYRGDLPTLRVGSGHRIRETDLCAWLSTASVVSGAAA